jgi:large subunit ribosomal protein L6
MSRVGKQDILIPSGVEISVSGQTVTVKGPKGSLTMTAAEVVSLQVVDGVFRSTVADVEDRKLKSLWGTTRALVNNMVKGVTQGFTKTLEVVGVGYRVAVAGRKLQLTLGYSHPIELEIPEGITAEVQKNTLTLSGVDRQKLGQFAAVVRDQRKPEPYKGKGIKYSDEVIRRKAGKVVKAVGG